MPGQILSNGKHFVSHMNDHAKTVLMTYFDPLVGELRVKTL